MLNEKDKNQLTYLILKLQDGSITSEQLEQLDNWLADNEEAFIFYCDFMKDITVLKSQIHGLGKQNIDVNGNLIKSLAECEQKASAIVVEKAEAIVEVEEPKKVKVVKPNKFFILFDKIVYIAAVFMIMFIVYAHVFYPKHSVEVATVVDQYHTVWGNDSERLDTNERVLTNQAPYKLEKGILSLVYDDGVEVLIEGPAEFKVANKGISVEYGRLYSYVSKTGRGFAVDTPNSRFIDLGTEFGVFVEENTSSELHVLKGEVQYYSGLPGNDKLSKTIVKDNAVRFDVLTGEIESIPVANELFARQVNSKTGMIWRGQTKVDLANIIANGNGFGSSKATVAIDPVSGNIFDTPTMSARVQEKNQYSPVADNAYIDGVFVPLGGEASQVISSTGDTYNAFPKTDGRYWIEITNRPVTGLQNNTNSVQLARLNGIEYGTESHPAIMMHANTGITFDLDAIRANMPDAGISRFTALCGISETLEGSALKSDAAADMFVLIDGKLSVSEHIKFETRNNIRIAVDINNNNRFLTLVSCSEWNDADWSIFGDPVLEIEDR